jgi:signal transduction histidine kinase/DNA-binding response OmpR family regulator
MSEARARILVVDDRRDQLITLQALLADVVDEIVCAQSGREALRVLLDAGEFAVMILDIQMPGMDGLELAQMIRQHKTHRQTPIIFVTASSDDLHVQRCYALGAVDFILAPVVPTALRAKVAVFVELHRKTQQVRRQAEVLRRRATQLHALTNASLGIHAAGSVPEILRCVSDAAQTVVGAECVMVRAAPAGEQAPPHVHVVGSFGPRGDTPMASLARLEEFVRDRGGPVRMSRAELTQEEWSVLEDDGALPFDAYLGAPLAWSDGQPMGILQVIGKRGGSHFDADDEAVIAQLAHVASIAVQNRVFGDAREASRLKDEFFTNLSHEFRNPLNAVMGWVQVLRKIQAEEADPAASADKEDRTRSDKSARALAAVERNTALLTRLVDDLLDVSRIVSRRMTIQTKAMALDEMVRQTVESLRVAAEAKSIRLRCALPDVGLDVLGDAQRLTQALWNLLSNAIKFTHAEGQVTVRLGREGAEAVIVVEDNGEGIAPDFLPHVFERFRQGNSTTMRAAGGGLGLGLSIVRAVVDLHGGSVRAESEGPGRGARFTLRLPLMSAPVELTGYHVLLVERDAQARSTLERSFAGLGARVTAVAEPAQALRALGASKPHVVVAPATEIAADALTALEAAAQVAELPVLAIVDGEADPAFASKLAARHAHASRSAAPGALARAIRSMVAAQAQGRASS